MEDQRTCINTLETFYNVTWHGKAAMTASFSAVSQMNAFVRRGDQAFGNITDMLFNRGIDPMRSVTPSLFDNEGSSPTGSDSDVVNVTPEALAAAADSLHKLVLQSHHELLRVFPAVPSHWRECVFFRLRGQRAFLVSGRLHAGEVAWIQVESLRGASPVVVEANFTSNDIQWRSAPSSGTVNVTAASQNRFVISGLVAGGTVLLFPTGDTGEFVASPLPPIVAQANGWGYHQGWVHS